MGTPLYFPAFAQLVWIYKISWYRIYFLQVALSKLIISCEKIWAVIPRRLKPGIYPKQLLTWLSSFIFFLFSPLQLTWFPHCRCTEGTGSVCLFWDNLNSAAGLNLGCKWDSSRRSAILGLVSSCHSIPPSVSWGCVMMSRKVADLVQLGFDCTVVLQGKNSHLNTQPNIIQTHKIFISLIIQKFPFPFFKWLSSSFAPCDWVRPAQYLKDLKASYCFVVAP